MIQIIKSIFQIIKSIILFILLICLVNFMVNNRAMITISANPLPFEIEISTFLVMIFFFVLGVFFGFLAFSTNMFGKSFRHFKDRLKIRKLQKEKKLSEKNNK